MTWISALSIFVWLYSIKQLTIAEQTKFVQCSYLLYIKRCMNLAWEWEGKRKLFKVDKLEYITVERRCVLCSQEKSEN